MLRPAKSEKATARRIAAMIQSVILLRGLLAASCAALRCACTAPVLRCAARLRLSWDCLRILGAGHEVCWPRACTQEVSSLGAALEPAEGQLLQAIRGTCGHSLFASLLQQLDGVLEEDVAASKNSFLNRQGSYSQAPACACRGGPLPAGREPRAAPAAASRARQCRVACCYSYNC